MGDREGESVRIRYCHKKVLVYRMAYGTVAWFIFIILIKVAKLYNSSTISVLFPRDLVHKFMMVWYSMNTRALTPWSCWRLYIQCLGWNKTTDWWKQQTWLVLWEENIKKKKKYSFSRVYFEILNLFWNIYCKKYQEQKYNGLIFKFSKKHFEF